MSTDLFRGPSLSRRPHSKGGHLIRVETPPLWIGGIATAMSGESYIGTRASFGASALATIALARVEGVHLNAQNWDEWLFPSGLMLLCGWGLFYNLWLFATGRGGQALCLGEPDAPTWTPLSAKKSTMLLGLFWMYAVLLLSAIRT